MKTPVGWWALDTPLELARGYAVRSVWRWQKPVAVSTDERTRHVYVVGSSGSGKSRFLRRLLLQDVEANRGFTLIDAQDLQAEVLHHIASLAFPHGDPTPDDIERLGDKLVLIEPGNQRFGVPGINLLQLQPGQIAYTAVDAVLAVLKELWADSYGARMEDICRNSLLLLQEQGLTVLEMLPFLSDRAFRNALVARCRNPDVRMFFEGHLHGISGGEMRGWIESSRNKWSAFLMNPLIRPILGQSRSTIHFRDVIDQGKWLIVAVSRDKMWRCWGDCQANGTVITFVERYLQIEPAHVRLWFHEHFANRLTARPPQAKRGGESRPRDGTPEKQEARPVGQTPERAESNNSQKTKLPDEIAEYKPIRFTLNLDPEVPYLKDRGFSDDVLARYGIGLCRRGMLKGYVAIPVWETPPGKNPYGYLGRWPGDDFDAKNDRPKYRWPANFPKQRFLFGLNEALDGTGEMPLLVVEGVFDALRCVQNGYAATVAVFGSSLSEEQAQLLADTGRAVVLMFDGDEAGRTGMLAAAHKLAPHAFVRMIRLDDGRQPDDLSADELQRHLDLCCPEMLPK